MAACVGYRDQLAERHPRLAATLLERLNRAGIREIVVHGERFDPRLHEASGTETPGAPSCTTSSPRPSGGGTPTASA